MEEEEGKERRETWGWPMEGLDSEVAARKGGGTQKGSDSGKINPPPKTRYDKGDRLHWGGGLSPPHLGAHNHVRWRKGSPLSQPCIIYGATTGKKLKKEIKGEKDGERKRRLRTTSNA